MTKRTTYHIVKRPNGWAGLKEGANRASVAADTKAAAIQKTRELAKAQPLGQVVVHKSDGKIQTEWTYGKDPRRYPS